MTKQIKIICSSLFFILIGCLSGMSETFLFIGDSITDGNWGTPKGYPCSSEERNLFDKNHILGHGYVEMIAGYFMGEYPESDYHFLNRGISGETLYNISSRWDKDVIENKPDVVSLLCGTNDIHYWLESYPTTLEEYDFEQYRETLDSLINYTKKRLPECKIILCTPFVAEVGKIGESDHYELRKTAIDSIANINRNLAIHNKDIYNLIDFNKLVTLITEETGHPEYWVWDGIHPTTALHYRMAKEWIDNYNSSAHP